MIPVELVDVVNNLLAVLFRFVIGALILRNLADCAGAGLVLLLRWLGLYRRLLEWLEAK